MKKRILAILLAAVMIFAATGCSGTQTAPATVTTAEPAAVATTGAPAAQTAMANPVTTVASLSELLTAQPGIMLNDAPAGSTNVSYGWIANIPPISQISFTYQGCDYTYRAAACGSDGSAVDISGVYTQFPSISTLSVSKPNAVSGSYVLKYDSTTGAGLASWYFPAAKCQYSLYTSNGCAGTMPLVAVMDSLYSCVGEVKNGKGTVLDVGTNAIIINFDGTGSAVLELGQVSLQDIAAGDSVSLTYSGDLNGTAVLVSITKLGTTATQELSGKINSFGTDWVYVVTNDNNIFEFVITNSTVITGSANTLSIGSSVNVTYTGELYGESVAQTIQITSIAPTPKPAPEPTAAPTSAPYVTRYADGFVTSAAGIYVTVNGILFTVNCANCRVTGICYEGVYASITYKDYGYGNYVVTDAAFYELDPEPDPYVSRECYGYVSAVSDSSVTVNGIVFSLWNVESSFVMSGYPEVGGQGDIYYNDYGDGYYELTYASFTSPLYQGELTDQEIDEFLNSDEFNEFVDYLENSGYGYGIS